MKKQTSKQIGGFNFEFSKAGTVEFLRISTLKNEWSLTLKQTNFVYSLLKDMWESGYEEYVHEYAQLNYISSSVTPDLEYTEGFVKVYNDYCKRLQEATTTRVKETEKSIIKEEIAKQTILDDGKKE